jgi:hypothetical protein
MICRFCEQSFEIKHCEGVLALFVWNGGCYDCYEQAGHDLVASHD